VQYILDLSIYPRAEGTWLNTYSTFRSLARGRGVDVHWLSVDGPGAFPEGLLEREIEAANAFLLRAPHYYFDFTKSILSRLDSDWWSTIPEKVRTSCNTKKTSEPESKFPDSAYLDLLDYRAIWRHHWEYFSAMLGNAEIKGGKNKATSYFHRLNEIGKLIMHPTKTHSGGISLPASEIDFLSAENQRSVVLWRLACDLEVRP
jgi:hypothetical protein